MTPSDQNEKAPGNTKWNHLQKDEQSAEDLSENFSGEDNFDGLRAELEIDHEGNRSVVDRARFVDPNSPEGAEIENPAADNKIIENRESLKNRDLNYDIDPDRYPPDHPDNHTSRGNIDFGK